MKDISSQNALFTKIVEDLHDLLTEEQVSALTKHYNSGKYEGGRYLLEPAQDFAKVAQSLAESEDKIWGLIQETVSEIIKRFGKIVREL